MSDNVFLLEEVEESPRSDFYLATVTEVSSSGVKFLLDGQTAALAKQYKQLNTGKTLAVDDRIVVMKQSGTYIVMGRISYDNSGGGGGAEPSSTLPVMDGVANVGTETAYARGDHIHPADTSKANVAETVSDVSYNSSTNKLQKTINGTTTDIVTISGDSSEPVIPYARVKSTSTSTAFVAEVDGITELKNGQCVILMNDKVNSASNCTLNVNDLGDKPIYLMNVASSRVSTQWNTGKTALFVYNTERENTGCWDFGILWDTNTTYDLDYFGIGTCTCDTPESTLAKTAYWNGYGRQRGQIFFCYFKYAVPVGSTLKIGSATAASIYVDNARWYTGSSGSEKRSLVSGDIQAGDGCLMRFDGTDYVVMWNNRWTNNRSGSVTGIKQTSTDTLDTLGIISGTGSYIIYLQTLASFSETASVYMIRKIGSSYYSTAIKEGTHARAPRISNGVLTLNTYTTGLEVAYYVIQL